MNVITRKASGVFTAAWVLSCPLNSNASNYQGTISHVTPYGSFVYVVIDSGNLDGAASACTSNASATFQIDPGTSIGKALISTALASKLAGKVVYAYGNGVCVSGAPFSGVQSETLVGLDLKS